MVFDGKPPSETKAVEAFHSFLQARPILFGAGVPWFRVFHAGPADWFGFWGGIGYWVGNNALAGFLCAALG